MDIFEAEMARRFVVAVEKIANALDRKTEPTISKMEQVDEPERNMAEDIVESFGFKAESYRQAKAKDEPQTCSFSDCDNFKNPDYERCIECKRKQIKLKTEQTEREGE